MRGVSNWAVTPVWSPMGRKRLVALFVRRAFGTSLLVAVGLRFSVVPC